jgi:hypothetical protein
MGHLLKEVNIEDIKKIVLESDSLVEVTKKMGYDPYHTNMKKNIERLIKQNNISIEHFSTVKRVREYSKRYDEEVLNKLINNSSTLKDVLMEIGLLPIESNYKTLKKYLRKYNINYSHIKSRSHLMADNSNYSEDNLKKIVLNSQTFREVFEKLGLNVHGNNYKTLHKYINKYNINISHFNANAVRVKKLREFNKIPTEEILVENSTYAWTNNLKIRLYNEGLKKRICEKCGQDENWFGEHMSLILDHINGKNDDNRIENLRIVCPNCNGTLPTHCGKNTKKYKESKVRQDKFLIPLPV